MLEKRFTAVQPQSFTSNGTSDGVITIADASLFKVKQIVILRATGQNIELQVKRVLNPTQMKVGLATANIITFYDISAFTVAAGATVEANEQLRPTIDADSWTRATYEEEPTVAVRTVLVDKLGNKFDNDNPIPVAFDGTVSIGEVRITAADNDPNPGDVHSSVRISDGTNDLAINSDGSLKPVGLFTMPYDAILPNYPSSTQEVYTSYTGGLSGTPVQVVTVNYTDATKNLILNVFRTPQN